MMLDFEKTTQYIRLAEKLNWEALIKELLEATGVNPNQARFYLGCYLISRLENQPSAEAVAKLWVANYPLQRFTGLRYKTAHFPLDIAHLDSFFEQVSDDRQLRIFLERGMNLARTSSVSLAKAPAMEPPDSVVSTGSEERRFLRAFKDRAEIDRKYNLFG